jgi:ribosomal protein L7/L12
MSDIDATTAVFAVLAFFLSVVAVAVAVSARSARSNPMSEARLARLEKRVAELAVHTGMPAPAAPDGMDDVLALVESGQKIAAIKLYREKTGVGLAEAKGAVEDLEAAKAQQ